MLAATALATNAHATVFDFSFDDGADSGSGQFVATAGPSIYTVTGITGTVDGSAITGLSTYGVADQLLYEPAPYVDHRGIAFSAASGLDYNLFTTAGVNELCASNVYASCGGSDGVPTAFSVTFASGVPEPAAWALMLVGFGGLGAALRSARKGRAAFAR